MDKRTAFLKLMLLWAVLAGGCGGEADEKEFLQTFSTLSDTRLAFRKNMKALGDSSRSHRDFSSAVLANAMADTAFEKTIDRGYAAFNDSIRRSMQNEHLYFVTQYTRNKPLIGEWERSEMGFDRLVQQIKEGDLSEREGLDSMQTVLQKLRGFIRLSDSLVTTSTGRYWAFRKSWDEYRYNRRNLQVLYAGRKDRPAEKK
jgi:hypothetical protein